VRQQRRNGWETTQPMGNVAAVAVFDSQEDLSKKAPAYIFRQSATAIDVFQ
jgi:hypothetical protein